jgi:hypothetical protein
MSPNIILLLLFILIAIAIAVNFQSSEEIETGEKFDESIDDSDTDESIRQRKYMTLKNNMSSRRSLQEICRICNKINHKCRR